MTYTDYYLRFADEADMQTVYRQPAEDDQGITYPDCFVDIIGKIVATPGEYDEDGNVRTPPVYADGWHVNVTTKGALPDALKPYQIETPSTPYRVWAK